MTDSNKLEPHVIRAGVVIVLGTIMAILDTTIVAVALDTLAKDFHTSITTIQWVTTAYLLAMAVVIPVSGWGVHRLGAKPLYIWSLVLFLAGSILCGFAWSVTALILFRVVQGIGGGMIMPVGQSILAQTAGPEKMGRVMALIGVPTLLGPILGPVIGGVIVSNVSWRWIFFVNIPIGVAALLLAWKFLPKTTKDRDHRFDLWGFLLLSPGLALLVYGLSAVGSTGSLTAPSAFWPMVSGAVLCVGFVFRSLKAPEPLMDMRLFKRRSFSIASMCIFVTGATLYGTMFLLPLYYQIVRGQSPWMAGLLLAPQGIAAAIMMRPAGALADKYGPRAVVPLGMVLLALGTLAYTQVSATSSYALLSISLFVRGLGLGLAMMPVFAASYRDLSHAEVPRASTSTNILRQVGGSLGVAAIAMVLQQQISHKFGHHASLGTTVTAHLPPSVLGQLAAAFATSFWWSFGLCALGVLPALFLPKKPVASEAPAGMILD